MLQTFNPMHRLRHRSTKVDTVVPCHSVWCGNRLPLCMQQDGCSVHGGSWEHAIRNIFCVHSDAVTTNPKVPTLCAEHVCLILLLLLHEYGCAATCHLQVLEPCCLLPVLLGPAQQLVLVGDHKQLGPCVSAATEGYGLKVRVIPPCKQHVVSISGMQCRETASDKQCSLKPTVGLQLTCLKRYTQTTHHSRRQEGAVICALLAAVVC